ncbi:MAG: ribonuclease III [Alphaproteobacteria bacterium]
MASNSASGTVVGRGRAGDPSRDPSEFAERLGHGFARPDLLARALTHPSAAIRQGDIDDSYERLEFLGDRVLGLIVADLLMARFPREPEGALALRHAELVRRETLAEVAGEIGLEDYLRLAKGEEAAGERQNPALRANACEAVIGALYLDGGLTVAWAFVERLWGARLEAETRPPQDAKTALQEWAQGRALGLPTYREVGREGPAHEPHFTLEVEVGGEPPARGQGRSKRLAEQAAATRLLARLLGD